MKKVFFLLILIFPLLLFSQSFTPLLENISQENCKQIKNGFLLVRLTTKSVIINNLKKYGKTELAKKVKEKQKEENIKVINAFKNNFSFCPVYYFHAEDTKDICENNLEGNIFNSKQEPIFHLDSVNIFFISEFGDLDLSNDNYHFNDKNNLESDTIIKPSYNISDIVFHGLILRYSDYTPIDVIRSKFNGSLTNSPKQKTLDKFVKKLNKKFLRKC